MAVNVDRYNVLEWLAAHPNGESLPVWVQVTRRLPEFHIAPTAWAVYTLRLLCADVETFYAATGCTEHGLRLLLAGKQQPTVGQLGWFALASAPVTPQVGAYVRRAGNHSKWFGELWARGAAQGGNEHIAELVWAYVLHQSIYRVMRTGSIDQSTVGQWALWAYDALLGMIPADDRPMRRNVQHLCGLVNNTWMARMVARVQETPKPVYTAPAGLRVFDGAAIDFDAVVGVVMGNSGAGAALTPANVWGATRKRGRPPGARNKPKSGLDVLRRATFDTGDGV